MTGIIVISFGVLLVYGGLHMSWAPLMSKADWSLAIGLVPLLLQVRRIAIRNMGLVPLLPNPNLMLLTAFGSTITYHVCAELSAPNSLAT